MIKLASKTLCIVPKSYGRAGIKFSGIRLFSNSPFGTPPILHTGKSAFEAQKKAPTSDENGEVGDEKTGEGRTEMRQVVRHDDN
jgi:hypothetical protein